jgi:hypothetical protein
MLDSWRKERSADGPHARGGRQGRGQHESVRMIITPASRMIHERPAAGPGAPLKELQFARKCWVVEKFDAPLSKKRPDFEVGEALVEVAGGLRAHSAL